MNNCCGPLLIQLFKKLKKQSTFILTFYLNVGRLFLRRVANICVPPRTILCSWLKKNDFLQVNVTGILFARASTRYCRHHDQRKIWGHTSSIFVFSLGNQQQQKIQISSPKWRLIHGIATMCVTVARK